MCLEVFDIYDGEGKSHLFQWNGGSFRLEWEPKLARVNIWQNQEQMISLPVGEVISRARGYLRSHPESSRHRIPQEVLSLEKENAFVKVKIYFDDVSAHPSEKGYQFSHFKSDVLVSVK